VLSQGLQQCSTGAGIQRLHFHFRVKFGAFLEHLETVHAGCFDRVASGHYAGIMRDPETGAATLRMTADAVKDQTYFLAHLSQVNDVKEFRWDLKTLSASITPAWQGTSSAQRREIARKPRCRQHRGVAWASCACRC
jgi:tRNA methyl transferase